MSARPITIAIEGCCHGELDTIYAAVEASSRDGSKVDLLLICGDFETLETEADLENMAVPPKYRHMNCFHEYVTGVKVAPVPTIFVGGNHEASNILQSLYYGGYVAPNIYFLGFAGVVNFGFLRICGISGIQHDGDYLQGHHETPPFDRSALHSVYHIRQLEVYRLAHLAQTRSFARPSSGSPPKDRVNIMLSHDWPSNIYNFGDRNRLLRLKPGLTTDVNTNKLGSDPLWNLLDTLRPQFWFCAHHHVKFAAVVPWMDEVARPLESLPPPPPPPPPLPPPPAPPGSAFLPTPPVALSAESVPIPTCCVAGARVTRFLALDKVLPGRDFLQVLTIPVPIGYTTPESFSGAYKLEWDLEWLGILQRTYEYLHVGRGRVMLPPFQQAIPTFSELQGLRGRVQALTGSLDLTIPRVSPRPVVSNPTGITFPRGNAQTDLLLAVLGKPHKCPWTIPSTPTSAPSPTPTPIYAASAEHSCCTGHTCASEIATPQADANELDLDF
jgi:lariat debranching enzyme